MYTTNRWRQGFRETTQLAYVSALHTHICLSIYRVYRSWKKEMLKITNTTSIETKEIEDIVEAIIDTLKIPRNMDVMVYNRRYDFHGCFRQGGTYQRTRYARDGSYVAVERSKARVFIRIATEERYPYHIPARTYRGNSGYRESLQLTLREMLVYLIAHELRHSWQKIHPRIDRKMWKVWKSKRKAAYYETDCEVFAKHVQREYRKLEPQQVISSPIVWRRYNNENNKQDCLSYKQAPTNDRVCCAVFSKDS